MNRVGWFIVVVSVVINASPLLASDLFHALSNTQNEAVSLTSTSSEPTSAYAQSNRDPTIMRYRSVRIAIDALDAIDDRAGSDLSFNLFDDVKLSGTVTNRVAKGTDTRIISGRIRGHRDSSFTLVWKKGVLIGNIRAPGLGTYQIRYLANGVHEIRKIDETQFPPCGTDDTDQVKAIAAAPARQNAGGCDDDGSVIDMLVVYTEEARLGEGGTAAIEALIALSEAETNQAYANSLITNTQINVVLTYEVDYIESGSSGTDRAALTDPSDGFMDEIHDLRMEYAADVVAMIVNSFEVCGRASFSISAGNVPHPEIAFNVVQASCSAGNYTFGHELAHNQGCRHNRERDPSDGGAFLYSHGYREPVGIFRTVMAGSETDVPRIQYFSNPNVLFNGEPTGLPQGDPASADNALTIENTSFNVANFRRSNDCNQNGICDDIEIATGVAQDCNNNGLPDDCEDDCNGNGLADDCDIANGISVDCTGNGIPDECESDCNINGMADSCDIMAGGSQDTNANGVPDECEPPVLYVDQNATGLGLGINWTDAFTDLHEALTVAANSIGLVEEIWVAKGIYTPAPPGGDRLISYELPPDVGVYGGFSGTETIRNQRNSEVNITVLSGDLNGDDGPGFANAMENARTVVTSFAKESGASTILDGFVISGANAIGAASFSNFNGGGMNIWNGGPTVSNCLFTSNQAYSGGGIFINNGSNAVVSRCRFVGNSSVNLGAGIAVNGASTPEIRDCVFLDNLGQSGGAGLVVTSYSDASVSHCTFVDNMVSGGFGGGILLAIAGGRIDLDGCILWSTTPTNEPAIIANGDGALVAVQHSVIFEGAGGIAAIDGGAVTLGAGNIEDDPLLAQDRVHLLPGSPCVDRGSLDRNAAELDIDGESRVRNCIADMGADESDFFSDCNTNGQPDACDIINGTSEDVNQTNVPDECDLQLIVDATNCPNVGNGTAENPFCDIQTAIDSVDPNDSTGAIIKVADGIYTGDGNRNLRFGGRSIILISDNGPGQCILDAEGATGVFSIDANDVRFILIEGLTITGGNALYGGGIFIDQASVIVRNCIIEGNTASSGGGLYSQHATLRLEDSFILQNKANGYGTAQGGGLWFDGGSTAVINCLIDSNTAVTQFSGGGFGGGMYVRDETHLIENSTISRNVAGGPGSNNPTDRLGGGLYLDVTLSVFSNVRINNCVIRENIARRGGGMYSRVAIALIDDSTIEDNLAQFDDFITEGGGVSMVNGSLLFRNCTIRRNRSVNGAGGGFSCVNGALALSQCQVTANEASTVGGAVYNNSNLVGSVPPLDLAGCTLVGNVSGGEGAGVYLRVASFDANQAFNLFNTIIWDNTGTAASPEDNQLFYWCNGNCQNTILHNCIEGWTGAWGGVGNIGDDPNFVNAAGLDNVIGTDDDDLHVHGGSPVIDSGDNASVPNGLVNDFEGNPRFADDPSVVDTGSGSAPIVDMGIYEGGIDCNGNGVPDPEDIANGTSQDCTGNGMPDECEPDCNTNGSADSCDIADGTDTDCDGSGVPDECELVGNDCNSNNVHDTCELFGNDCNNSGIPDECELVGNDCNFNGVPDECELMGNDCTSNGIPDECEITDCLPGDPTCQDCNNNGIPDACDIADCIAEDVTCQDCDSNGVPDECDIANGVPDLNGNGIPDRCSFPPSLLAGEVGFTKDRYLSFDPSTNVGEVTALRVTRVGSFTPWYVSCSLQDSGVDGKFSELVQAAGFCEWTDAVIHVRGCDIVPGNEYLIEATVDGVTFSSPLSIFTTAPQDSANRQFGDAVGSLVAGAWTAPDGLVTVNDITSVVQKFQLNPTAPHLSRVDNDGKVPNGIVASNDILRAVLGFAGGDFGYGVTNCTTGTCVPSCP